MRKNLQFKQIFMLLILALVPVLSGCTIEQAAIPTDANPFKVTFSNGAYNPPDFEIRQGQSVMFVNNSNQNIWPASNIHTTHSIYAQFDPRKPIEPGKSWVFNFAKKGIWKFHDHLEPTIIGTITVEETNKLTK